MIIRAVIILVAVGQTYHEHARLPVDDLSVRSVAFSPDGHFLASLSLGGKLRLWDVASARPVATFQESDQISCFAFASQGSKIAIGTLTGKLSVCQYNLNGFTQLISRRMDGIRSLAFSPPRDEIIAAALRDSIPVAPGVARLAGKLDLIDSKSLETIRPIPCDRAMISHVWFSPDGKRLAFSGLGLDLFVEDIARETRKSFSFSADGENDDKPPIYSVTFSTDGKLIAGGSLHNTARIWRLDDGALVGTLKGHKSAIMSIHFIDDNAAIATVGYNSTIKIWRTRDWQETQSIATQSEKINSMAYSPANGLLASAGYGKVIMLWSKDKDNR